MKTKIKPIWQLKEGSLIRFRDRFFRVLKHDKRLKESVTLISEVKDLSVISLPYFMRVEQIEVSTHPISYFDLNLLDNYLKFE